MYIFWCGISKWNSSFFSKKQNGVDQTFTEK